jgi:RNA ligase (TIGR02306 family)
MKVIKYEIPCSAVLSGDAKGLFPSFCRKTDEERIQNLYEKLKAIYQDSDEQFEITVKLDGSSMTMMIDPDTDEFLVCSRNLSMKETEGNTYWKVARENKFEEVLRYVNRGYGTHYAFSGELMGPGIQKNREKLAAHQVFVFNVYDIDKKRYLSNIERASLMYDINTNSGFNIKHVPEVGFISGRELFKMSLKDILSMASGPSLKAATREGIVFKAERHSFKVISNEYLLKEEE